MRITATNVLYALCLTLRGSVAAWKVDLPAWLSRRFQRVRPYRVFTRDEWLLAHDAAFDKWKASALAILTRRHRLSARIGGRSVDFSRNLWQLLGTEFEALCLFVSMLDKTRGANGLGGTLVEPWITRAYTRAELEGLFPGVRLMRSRVNHCLEALHEWLVSAAHLARTCALVAGSLTRRRSAPGARTVVWLGISATEIPDRDDRLDFSWAARYGYIDARKTLFFPPCALTAVQRAYLDSRGIAAVEPRGSFNPLSMSVRLKVLASSVAGFVQGLFGSATAGAYFARFMARAPHWDALFEALDAKTYVTSTSYAWPEKPELAVTGARGMRSLIWAYSANSPTFANADARFRDLGIARSIVIANEFWIWNRAYGEWTRNRQVETGAPPCELRIVGPLMCGNPAHLALEPRAARERLGLPDAGLCLGVFDMPPMNDAWRDEYGGGPPMISLPSYVAFWEAIGRILEQVPGSYAMVKLKRAFHHPYREVPALLKEMLDERGDWMRSGRIRLIDVNVDPYLPIAASDVAIGVPYTSPILAARSIKRPAFYLDPLALANVPSCPEYRPLTVCSDEEALAIVKSAALPRRAMETIDLAAVTPPAPSFPLDAATRETQRMPEATAATRVLTI